MRVLFGNVAAVEPYREEVSADLTADELRSRAEAEGLEVGKQTKAQLAAQLSGINRTRPLGDAGQLRVTVASFPDDLTLGEAFTTLTSPQGVWAAHSAAPPAWVAVDAGEGDPAKADALEALLAAEFGAERGEPSDVEDTHYTLAGPPGVHPSEED